MIITKLLGAYLRLRFRLSGTSPAIDIGQQLAQTRRVLIYMPKKVEQFGAALKSLEKLRALKPKWKITVISKLEMVNFIDSKLKVEILPYSKEDLNFAGLPKHSLKQVIKKADFDLALDFTLKFDLFTIQLFNISNASLKVCFANSEKSPFHNIEIRVNPAESLTNKYNAMIKYITMIAGTPQAEATVAPPAPTK